jgi:ribosomal protein L11 methyltransferase
VISARRHAQLNGVTLRLLRGDGGQPFRAGAFDLVLANISAPLLVERCEEIGRLARPGGALVLAGLLVTDLPAVAQAYARWGAAIPTVDGEWASLAIRQGARS